MAVEATAPRDGHRTVDASIFYTLKHNTVVCSNRIRSPAHSPHVSYSLAEALRRLRSSEENISDGPMLCTVNSAGSKHSLRTEFGALPPSLFGYLKSPGALSPGSSTVPEWSLKYGLSFVQNHMRVLDDSKKPLSRPQKGLKRVVSLYHLDSHEIYSWPLAVWSNGELATDTNGPKIPIIMIFGRWLAQDVALVQQHYRSSTSERWARLAAAPEWIFHDLDSIFGSWNRIWRLSARELKSRSLEVNDEIQRRKSQYNSQHTAQPHASTPLPLPLPLLEGLNK